MNTETMLDEIRDANLTYLMLAQALIRKDRAQALFRLGLSEEVADVVAGLSAAQILKIAAVVSTGRSNSFIKRSSWRRVTQGFSWSHVHALRDRVEPLLRHDR